MRIYRVVFWDDGGASAGFKWYASKRAAMEGVRIWKGMAPDMGAEIFPIEVPRGRDGLLAVLNEFANHADNG